MINKVYVFCRVLRHHGYEYVYSPRR